MKLRTLLDELESEGKLLRITEEVDPIYELSNIMNSLGERPTIFTNIKNIHAIP